MVSLCVLSYKRPDALRKCLESIWETADLPYQLIVNSDGGDLENDAWLYSQFKAGKISNLILNGGKNRGVGRSFQNCLGVAEGEYIFKIDADIVFKPKWLSTAISTLVQNKDVGAISLFDYHTYDPNDSRFFPQTNVISARNDCFIVADFVSSVYGFRRMELPFSDYELYGELDIPDDGLHQRFGNLAIAKEELCTNSGFGRNSVYVTMPDDDPAHAFKTPTSDTPLIYQP